MASIMRGTLPVVLLIALVGLLLPQTSFAGTPGDSYTIERYYTETSADTTQTTTTTAAWVDALTLTPSATKYFVIISSALTNNSSASYYTEVQLDIDGTAYSRAEHKPIDPLVNWRSFGTHKVIQLSSAAHTIKVQYRTENAAGTASIKRISIAALEVSNYYNQEVNAEATTTSTSLVDVATLTFTPPSQADYLILATANPKSDTANKVANVRLTIDGAADVDGSSSSTYSSPAHMEVENLTAASHTFVLQYSSETPATAYIKDARITAILLSDLGSKQYAESSAESFTALATYQDKTTLSFTPSTRNDWLILGSFMGRQEGTSYAFYGNLDVDGTSHGEYYFVPSTRGFYRNAFQLRKVNLSAAAHNIKIQYRTNNAASYSEAFIREANVIAIRIDSAESYSSSAHASVSNSFTSYGATVYLWAHGLRASQTYAVGYYDAGASGGALLATDSGLSSTSYGNLTSQADPRVGGAVGGTWHAVVFDSAYGSPPSNYNSAAAAAGYVTEDSFTVSSAAIPEFPGRWAALAAFAAAVALYLLMRKRLTGRHLHLT